MSTAQILAEAQNLAVRERVALLEKLWEQSVIDFDAVPVPAEHARIIKNRIEALKTGKTVGVAWSIARAAILQKYENRDYPRSAR